MNEMNEMNEAKNNTFHVLHLYLLLLFGNAFGYLFLLISFPFSFILLFFFRFPFSLCVSDVVCPLRTIFYFSSQSLFEMHMCVTDLCLHWQDGHLTSALAHSFMR